MGSVQIHLAARATSGRGRLALLGLVAGFRALAGFDLGQLFGGGLPLLGGLLVSGLRIGVATLAHRLAFGLAGLLGDAIGLGLVGDLGGCAIHDLSGVLIDR